MESHQSGDGLYSGFLSGDRLSKGVRSISTMATNEISQGPTSRYVVENVRRLKTDRDWSLADLSERMSEAGRPILPTGLHRLLNGKRRVDVDDLMALAAAFEVTPITLLLPTIPKGTPQQEASNVEITGKISVDAFTAWDWIRGERPLTDYRDDQSFEMILFRRRSLPSALVQYTRIDETGESTHEYDDEVLTLVSEALKEAREARNRGIDEHDV